MKKVSGLMVLVAAVAIGGCIKKKDFDFKNVTIDNWQPDWALPLINSKLTLKNLVQTGTIVSENSEGLYSLHYSGDLFSAKASDFIKIQDQSFTSPAIMLSIPQSIPGFSGTISDSSSGSFSYTDTSGAQLEHINAKGGNIVFNVSSTFNHNVTATLVLPTVKKDGAPLQVPVTIGPSATGSTTINLAGYAFDMTNGGIDKNKLPYKVRFTVTGTGQPLAPANSLMTSVNVTSIAYSYIDGFLGTYDIPIPEDTIYVGVFDNTLSANIFVRDPKIHLSFRNSVGLGVSTQFDKLYGQTNKGEQRALTLPPIAVEGATVPGETKVSKHTINSSNSSVQNVFNPAPNEVIYAGRVRVNPSGIGTRSFVTDSSMVSLMAEAELPAWFHIIEFSLQDTVKLVLPEDSSILNKAQFKMLMDNAMPLYGQVQVYFADSNYNVVDSLVPTANDIVGEAKVDDQGRVKPDGNTKVTTEFEMTHDEYNAMAPKVRHAIIRGRLKSSNAPTDVKIQSSNNLVVKLAFRFSLNVSSTDL